MTTLMQKPGLLRADTIDLQSHENPSAKDHTRGQYQPGYSQNGLNHAGSHHVQALRSATQDAYQEQHASPRIGGFDHNNLGPQGQTHMYDDEDDDEGDRTHNGMNGVNGNHYGGEYGEDDENSQDEDMDDELLDKISSSPSIEDEDIDFEFVYALHTFVATVEGQANATKGDTMVLLDDSNSYWWLVRVVKDGSIGYLPAEHIETPTERLARLNKHRNIDLSAAMLGDDPQKSKNPLKKAMRRRNAKTVNFAPPTYHEPEERQWSDEEEDDEVEDPSSMHLENGTTEHERQASQQSQQGLHAQQVRQVDQSDEQQRVQSASATIHRVENNNEVADDEPSSPVKFSDVQAAAPTQPGSQDSVQRSRKGVVRNTDSFFKDDTVETKKISLTPRLLRNDGDPAASAEQEPKQRPSFDTFDRVISEDKSSKEKQKKEKKGMLSGLFKRKDKGAKGGRSDTDEPERISDESGRSPQSKDSTDSELTPERKPSKLQKAAPPVVSPKGSPTETRTPQRDFPNIQAQQQGPLASLQNHINSTQTSQNSQHLGPELQAQPSRFPSLQEKRSVFAPISDALRSKSSGQDNGDPAVKPVYSKRAKERFAIDESDSENDSTPTARSSVLHRSISPLENNEINTARPASEMRVSPLANHQVSSDTTRAPLVETEPIEQSDVSQWMPMEASPTSPSDRTASTSKQSPTIPTHTPSTSRSTPTWSDASLRSYMDNDQDIRDLLVIVHDKTNVTPVGPEHPLMKGLFTSERTKLADMQSQLDSMLMSWLSKKNPSVMAKT